MTAKTPTLLLLRPLNDSKRVAKDFEDMGCKTLINPLFDIQHLTPALPDRRSFDIIIVTSEHALPYLSKVKANKETPLYCVGDYTATKIQQMGFENITKALTAQDLLLVISKGVPQDKKALYLSGTEITLDFQEKLTHCVRLSVYKMLPLHTITPKTKQALENNEITHIAVYSKRSVTFFHKLFSDFKVNLKHVQFLALGEACAMTLRELNYRFVNVAETPTQKGMIDLLRKLLNAPYTLPQNKE